MRATGPLDAAAGPAQPGSRVSDFLGAALSALGDRTVFGLEVLPPPPGAAGEEGARLVRWAAGRAGVDLPGETGALLAAVGARGTAVDVATAVRTAGALLFSLPDAPGAGAGRVAISLGNGQAVEARGPGWQVRVVEAPPWRWTSAGVVAGLAGPLGRGPLPAVDAGSALARVPLAGYDVLQPGANPWLPDGDGGRVDGLDDLVGAPQAGPGRRPEGDAPATARPSPEWRAGTAPAARRPRRDAAPAGLPPAEDADPWDDRRTRSDR